MNVKPQPYTFSNPFDHAQEKPFPLPLYQPLQLSMIGPLNLPPSPQHIHNLHLKFFAPPMGVNSLVEG